MAEAQRVPTFSEYLRIFRRYWWLPVAGLVVGVGVSALADVQSETVHRARVDVLLQIPTSAQSAGDAGVQARLTESAARVGESGRLTEQVLDEMGVASVPQADFTPVVGANVVEVSARSNDPVLASRAALAYAVALAESTPETLDLASVVLTDDPPVEPLNLPLSRRTTLYAFAGLIIGLAGAVALELRTRSSR